MFCQMTIRTITNNVPGEMIFSFEAFDVDTLDELRQVLADYGFASGRRFSSRPDGEGARRVVSTRETLISRDVISQVSKLPEVLRDQRGAIIYDPSSEGDF